MARHPEYASSDEGAAERVAFTCTLDCGSRCELVAFVRDGEILRIDTPAGQPDTPERPRLIPCARGRAHRRLLTSPERVLAPLRRAGPRGSGVFHTVSWDDALDEVAERLAALRDRAGSLALLHATGSGSISGRGFSGAAASRRFFSHWGPVTATSGNASFHCSAVAAELMLGGVVAGSDRATLPDSRLIILWGMNPAETRMGPNTDYFIAEARDLGAKVILIDPRFTSSGVLADEWIPIRPGTDAALAAALGHVMETQGLVDPFTRTHTVGYDLYRDYILGQADGVAKTPQWAAAITGVPAATTQRLAVEFATTKPATLLPGWGPQRSAYGEQTARAWIALACMTGNVGLRGGGVGSVGTRDNIIPLAGLPPGPCQTDRLVSAAAWARATLNSRLQPPVEMAYIVASNLINRSPDANRNRRALERLSFIVVHEQMLTPTARCADIVLPICTDLERSDLVTSWGHDLHVFLSRQAVAPVGESRTDYWAFAQLARRLGFGDAYTGGKTEAQWIDHLLAQSHLDCEDLEREGIVRLDGEPRVALAEFRRDPFGHPLSTPSGLIEIGSQRALERGLPPVPSYVPDDAGAMGMAEDLGLLQLVTPHSELRANSCLHPNPWLKALEPHTLWISPEDVRSRGMADGDWVEVWNQFGCVCVPVKVTERIMPGVVCLYQGAWQRIDASGRDVGGCANTLTSQRLSPTGGYTTHSNWVRVSRLR